MRRVCLPLVLVLVAPLGARAETIYAARTYYTATEDIGFQLVRFDSAAPQTIKASVPITGALQYAAQVKLEFDPQSRALYGFWHDGCSTLCPPIPFGAGLIQLETGVSWFMDWPDFPYYETFVADYDIDPQTRELRFFGTGGRNLRYRLGSLELIEDELFDQPGSYLALAHTWPGAGGGGVDTFAVLAQPATGFQLVRIGGAGGTPPASSGEVTSIGPLAVEGTVGGFDISPSGAAYLSTFEPSYFLLGEPVVNRFYSVDLATASVQELGTIGIPDPYETVTGIAVAPEGPGPTILEVPSLSGAGVTAFATALAILGFWRIARQRAVG